MTEITLEITLEIAEAFLTEMLDAEAAYGYEGFTKRFERSDLANFGIEKFKSEIAEVHEDLGA